MFHSRFRVGLHPLFILVALSACGGGGGGGGSSAAAAVRTLAYAPLECREDDRRRSTRQELRIRQGEGVPVTVTAATETYLQEPPVFPGACGLAGTSRSGLTVLFAGGVQRLGVSPDGSTVVFEKTNRFSVIGLPQLAADREGFFLVRADGSGLRRLGPASRESLTRLAFDASVPGGLRTNVEPTSLSFTPDGRTIVFTDRGPGPADEDAAQIVIMDLETGTPKQVTRLPRATPGNPPDPVQLDIQGPSFCGPDDMICFWGSVNPDGLNPKSEPRSFSVRQDGTDLNAGLPGAPELPTGGTISPSFQITAAGGFAFDLALPGGASEVFFNDNSTNLLQLTTLGRADTGVSYGTVVAGQRVLFTASADPFGTNPSENCQIFSIDRLGTDLRQLTTFSQGDHSTVQCGGIGPPPGCGIGVMGRDPVTGAIVFPSSCDPFGRNPNGGQIFAMNSDGTNLRQLTDTRGFTTEPDGTVDVELPGPFAPAAQGR